MITTRFRDGDRIVVVFEGANKKDEEAIDSFLRSVGGRVQEAPPVDAKPVETAIQVEEAEEEAEPEIPPEEAFVPVQEEPDAVFEDGPATGMTPEEVIIKYQQQGFMYITKYRSEGCGPELRKGIDEAVSKYLAGFKNTDPEEYSRKLTVSQILSWFKVFRFVIPKEMAEKAEDPKTREAGQRELLKQALRMIQQRI